MSAVHLVHAHKIEKAVLVSFGPSVPKALRMSLNSETKLMLSPLAAADLKTPHQVTS